MKFRSLMNYFSPDVRKQIHPESYAETGGSQSKWSFNPKKRTRQLLESYITTYEQGGMLSEAIDLYPLFMFSKGYSWDGEPGAIDQCREFMEGFDYELAFSLAITSPLVCGDGFQEILQGRGGSIVGLLYRDPTAWDIVYDEYGLVNGYTQTVSSYGVVRKELKFEENQIFHTWMIPGLKGNYGTPLIKRCYDEIMRDAEIAEASANAIKRHGTPKWWARLGLSGKPVSDTVLNAVTQKLQDLNSKNDIATQYDCQIQSLDTSGVGNIQAYQDFSLIRLCGAMGVPGELLGFRQGTTDNTAVSRIGAFLQKCETFNKRFARALNIQVFDQVTGKQGAAKIKFNSVLPSQQAEMAGWIVNLIKANPMDPEAYAPKEWVKQVLGIPDNLEEASELELKKDE